jgi:polyhydroxybutyrate depolymerase
MSTNLQARWVLALAPATLLLACTVETPDPGSGSSAAGSSSAGASILPMGGSSSPGTGGANGGSAVAGSGVVAGGASSSGGEVGSAPVGGSTGVGGTGAGGTGTGGPGPGPTAGCGKVSAEEPGKDVLHNIMVNGVARRYWTKLPTSYDGAKPTPLVFYGPGCGASGVEGAPLDNSIKDAAMRVFVIGTGGCFDTAGPEPETGYFNAVLDEVQANYCTDHGKVFVSGYSSGAWLSDLLACTAGDRITAIGTAAGGFKAEHPPCKGNPAAMFHAGTNDGANPITKLNAMGVNEGSSAARDRLLLANGCTMETKVWDPAFPYCKQYVGCTSPVIWCQQDGVGHSNGEEVARTGWWKFWSSLP